jgi:hypothetical protein
MPRVKLEDILDEHERDVRRALAAAIRSQIPDAEFDERAVSKAFKREIGRKFSTWTRVRESYVDPD